MGKPLIEGGYILISRKIIESEIWEKPPLYLKIWIYLLSQAQHKPYRGLNRGELWTTIPEIQEACSWYVGFRKETPTKDQVFNVINWMRNRCNPDESRFPYGSNDESNARATMIATMRATRGILVNIANYSVYQDPKSYESNDDDANEKATGATREQREYDTINKNDKNDNNDKNVKNKNIKEQTPLTDMINSYTANPLLVNTLNDFAEMRKEIKYPLTEKALTLMLKKLDKISSNDDEKIKILEESIMNRYRGVFELKKGVSRGSNKGHSSKDEDDDGDTKYAHLYA